RARALADSLGNPALQSLALNVSALAAERLRDLDAAQELGARALATAVAAGDSGAVHDAATQLAVVALDRGDAATLERWLERARVAGAGARPESRAVDLTALGTARQYQGRYDEAERDHRAAYDLARANGLTEQMLQSMCCMGDLRERRGDPRGALDDYGAATAIAETLRTLQRTERGAVGTFGSRLFMF